MCHIKFNNMTQFISTKNVKYIIDIINLIYDNPIKQKDYHEFIEFLPRWDVIKVIDRYIINNNDYILKKKIISLIDPVHKEIEYVEISSILILYSYGFSIKKMLPYQSKHFKQKIYKYLINILLKKNVSNIKINVYNRLCKDIISIYSHDEKIEIMHHILSFNIIKNIVLEKFNLSRFKMLYKVDSYDFTRAHQHKEDIICNTLSERINIIQLIFNIKIYYYDIINFIKKEYDAYNIDILLRAMHPLCRL